MMPPYRTAWNILKIIYIFGLITKLDHIHFILCLKNYIKKTPQRLPLKFLVVPLKKISGRRVSLEFPAY